MIEKGPVELKVAYLDEAETFGKCFEIHRHRRFTQVILLIYTLCHDLTQHNVLCTAPAPVDYLIPPPAPHYAVPVTRLNPAQSPNLLASESRTVPQHYAATNGQALMGAAEEPGLINRVARWFGFAQPQDQQISATGSNKQLYYYPKPQQLGTGNNKEPCNLCNKYPWVPMMFNSIQYGGASAWDPTKQNQAPANGYVRNNFGPYPAQHLQHAASNVKQRAVQFHYPPPPSTFQMSNSVQEPHSSHIQYSTGPFLPIPIPNLSSNALPPLYNAQPFHQTVGGATAVPPTTQQLPSTESAQRFADNIASAHSEIHLDTVVPTQIPPSTPIRDPNFEIIQSHRLADYISSVEYPANYVPSQSYDVKLANTGYRSELKPTVSTGRYQHATFSPNLNQHIPASQILTDPSSFIVGDHQQQQQQQPQYNQHQSTLQSEFIEHSTVVYDHQFTGNGQGFELDNYASASIHNSSIVEQPQQVSGNIDTWTLESNDYLYATTTSELPTSTVVETTTTQSTDLDFTTENEQSNDVEFVASVQTTNQNQNVKSQASLKLWPHRSRDRETPKRLLDAPIQHIGGHLGSPRPFTRDPSDFGLRLVAKNHKFPEPNYQTQSMTGADPTPTSTYSSIDASGHYAGMSPPALPTTTNTDNNKPLFLPFTTKVQPRPFESTRDNSVTKSPVTDSFSTWSQAQNTDLHTPAESMLVSVKSEIDPMSYTSPKPRTTKYLTKILASNLRELLQREHTPPSKLKQSPNSIGFDLHALQKNIDDWTEQEYTSLSHRPSTPTILGRSKHIPKEYLPSTTAITSATLKPSRQSKTTKGFFDTSELPASINGLEPLYDRSSTKHIQYTPISDNHIQEFYDSYVISKSKTTTTVQPPTTTTRTTTMDKPLYLVDMDNQEPEALWRKAKVSISPKTKEKVYVVTPQPRFFSQMQYTTTTSTTESPLNRLGSGFKSPRFLVRPTPGNGTSDGSRHSSDISKENFSQSYFSRDLFGLKGLSAYVPAEPVEINDGNSKVLNIGTPASNLKPTTPQNIMDLTKDRHSTSKKKPIMAPSPR